MEEEKKSVFISIPMAIIFSGLLIAIAIFLSRGTSDNTNGATPEIIKKTGVTAEQAGPRPVGPTDHIKGNPNAEIVIIEYSDTECPFCKKFHDTMNQIIDKYGKDGNVAWVYRHFPLDQLHSKARKESEATECASELKGNAGFWDYIDELMRITPSNNQLDLAELPAIAERVGINKDEFMKCLDSGKHAKRVDIDLEEILSLGGTGTPWSFMIKKGSAPFIINGAQPFSVVSKLIDEALKQ